MSVAGTTYRSAIPPDRTTRRVVVALRMGLLALCAGLSLALVTPSDSGRQLVLLAVLAAVMSLPGRLAVVVHWRPVLEGVLAAAVISTVGGSPTPLLPYLLVAPIAAGLLAGFGMAAGTVAASAVTLVVLRHPTTTATALELAEWVGLALAVGLLAAWARVIARESQDRAGSYAAANRLLTQLRDVARALPTGLDEVSLAQAVIAEAHAEVDFERGALFTTTGSGYLAPAAFFGAERLDWEPSDDPLWERASRSGRAEQTSGQFDGDELGHRAVVPMLLGDRAVGAIAFERGGAGWTRQELATAAHLADEAAVRIDTGALYSELRALATVEERRRLAREIHDGVAQEVAALGFMVDDLGSRTSDLTMRADLRDLRAQLTRIVSELRISIFDLRSDVESATGLGAALGSYVRQVGAGSGMTVHLVLDESASRLSAGSETELMRIAQEAITNARKHSQARNLWVTCRVDPPRAFLRVADDGLGLGLPRDDSYGLEIMKERATRLGASLSVRNRVGGGTVIEVTLDGTARGTSDAGAMGRGTR